MEQGIGKTLRAARKRWGLPLREVQERSKELAEKWNKPAYAISASWLVRVERENREISATKLIVLAAIYQLSADQMLGMIPSQQEGLSLTAHGRPNATLLLTEGPLEKLASAWIPDDFVAGRPPEATTTVETPEGLLPAKYLRGVIGLRDRTLEPMVRVGSMLLIDSSKRAIAGRRDWTNEFDRPIYFLATREGFAVGFCELDKTREWLSLVPHMLSHESVKHYKYPDEVEVVGTVEAVLCKRTG